MIDDEPVAVFAGRCLDDVGVATVRLEIRDARGKGWSGWDFSIEAGNPAWIHLSTQGPTGEWRFSSLRNDALDPDATYSIRVQAFDSSGNRSTVQSRRFRKCHLELKVVSGDGQVGTVGKLSQALVAKVTNSCTGEGVSGVQIRWDVQGPDPNAGAQLVPDPSERADAPADKAATRLPAAMERLRELMRPMAGEWCGRIRHAPGQLVELRIRFDDRPDMLNGKGTLTWNRAPNGPLGERDYVSRFEWMPQQSWKDHGIQWRGVGHGRRDDTWYAAAFGAVLRVQGDPGRFSLTRNCEGFWKEREPK